MEYLDSESIIDEVQKYPYIYDPNHESYKNMNLKRQTWFSITETILEDKWGYMDDNIRRRMAKEVQKRWKSIKDSYVKNVKKRERKGRLAVKMVRPYVFHKQLSFLKPTLIHRNKSLENMKVHQEDDYDDNIEIITCNMSQLTDVEDSPPQSKSAHKRKKIDLTVPSMPPDNNNIEKKLTDDFGNVNVPPSPPPPVELKRKTSDPDEMFLLSQIPVIKRLNPSEKLDFQVKFMQLLQSYATPHDPFSSFNVSVKSPASSIDSSSSAVVINNFAD